MFDINHYTLKYFNKLLKAEKGVYKVLLTNNNILTFKRFPHYGKDNNTYEFIVEDGLHIDESINICEELKKLLTIIK